MSFFSKSCGDCDHYDFDTGKCLQSEKEMELNDCCDNYYNAKSMDSNYFGDYN